jgi:hypothetical protein
MRKHPVLRHRSPASVYRKQRAIIEALETRRLFALPTLMGASQNLNVNIGADVADPTRDVVYFVDQTDNRIVALDTDTGATAGLAAPLANVSGLAVSVDGSRLYASEPGAFQVEVFSLPTMRSIATLPISGLGPIVAIANNEIVGTIAGNIEGFDASNSANGTPLFTMPADTNGLLRTNATGTMLYSRERGQGGGTGPINVWDVSTAGSAVAGTPIPGPTPGNSTDYAVDAASNHAYFEDANNPGIEVTLLGNGNMTTWDLTPTGGPCNGVATLPGGAYIYAMTTGGKIEKFNQNGVAQATFTLPSAGTPESLVITPNGNLVCTFATGIEIVGISTLNITETPPSVNVIAPANQTAVRGVSTSFLLGRFSESDATAPFSVDVNWGDGSPDSLLSLPAGGTIPAQNHTYATATTDTVSIVITDADGTVSNDATFTVTVSPPALINVTPPARQTAIAGRASSIALGSFTETFATTPYTVDVHWGDGSSDTTFLTSAAGIITTHVHTYASPTTDTGTITVTDALGNVSNAATFTVVVSQAATIVLTPAGAQSATTGTGQSFALGSFTASNATTPFSVDVNWGDGSADSIFSMSSAGTIPPQNHTYTHVTTETADLTVSDANGNVSNMGTILIAVDPAATIVLTAPPAQTTAAGISRSFSLGTFVNHFTVGTFNVDVNWGDGSAHTTFAMASAGVIPPQTHTYGTAGMVNASVTVTDGGGHTSNVGAFAVTATAVEGTPIIITVNGTSGSDIIRLQYDGANITDTINGITSSPIPISQVSGIQVFGNAGADKITIKPSMPATLGVSVFGGNGADTIIGGPGNDTLNGGNGKDSITAGSGDDLLIGGKGPDTLIAGSGIDSLKGGKGDDSLLGGAANDSLRGGAGDNILHGGTGDTTFFAVNGEADTLFGGGGNDTAFVDPAGLDVIPDNDIQNINIVA